MKTRSVLPIALILLLLGACAKPQVKKPAPPVKKAVTTRSTAPGYLGVVFTAGYHGLRVVDVFPNSPASRAGLIKGDTLVRAGGRPIGGVMSFRARIRSMREGDRLHLEVMNLRGTERKVVAVINELPPGLTLYGRPRPRSGN